MGSSFKEGLRFFTVFGVVKDINPRQRGDHSKPGSKPVRLAEGCKDPFLDFWNPTGSIEVSF